MALQANALVTIVEARAYLKVGTSTEETDLVTDLINRASDFCEGPDGANRPLKERVYTALRLPAPRRSHNLRPPATPIKTSGTITLSLDGATQTVWRTEADGEPTDSDVVVCADDPDVPSYFSRAIGWTSYAYGNPSPILLAYTGGFPTLPGDLKDAVFLVIENLYRAQEKKLTEVNSIGGAGGAPSISFSPGRIPMKAREILDSYRVVNL